MFINRFIIVTCIVVLAGCSSQKVKEDSAIEKNNVVKTQQQSNIIGTPSANSKFSKLELGMSSKKVTDLIGMWTDKKTYQTGKVWIPFYFGPDTVRSEFLYKNEGRLVIGGNDRLIKIIVDVSEDGYK